MKKITKKIQTPYMIREIYEQTETLEKILDKRVGFVTNSISFDEFSFFKNKIKKIKRFLFLGCGSSANASLLGNYYFEEFTGKNCEYEFADEFIVRRAILEPGTAVVLLSQSGKTRDILLSAEIARDRGAFIIGISNTSGSKLEKLADVMINTEAGDEKGVAATKSFSAQIITLFLMSLYFADIFDVKIKDREEIFKELKILPDKISKALKTEKEIKKIAKNIFRKNNLLVTGRKFNFPIALEGAHKIKETAYIHAEGVASEELRHGGEAMLNKDFPVFCIIPGDSVYKDNLVLAKELKKIKVETFITSDKNLKTLKDLSKTLIIFPKTIETLAPVLSLVILQLLAYHLAMTKKIDVDNPRNIQKYIA